MDRGVWWATVRGFAKNWTRLSDRAHALNQQLEILFFLLWGREEMPSLGARPDHTVYIWIFLKNQIYIYIYVYIYICFFPTTKISILDTCYCSVTKSCPTLQYHGLQHANPLCPSLSPGVCQVHVHWVSDAIQPSHPLLPSSPFVVFPNVRVFSIESALCIKWSRYWNFSFSISPSSKYSGLISFRIDWFDLAV